MIWVTVLIIILSILVSTVVGFFLGVRYAGRTLLPVWLAKMSQKELEDLAERAARERRTDV